MGVLKVGIIEKANGDPVDLTKQEGVKAWIYHTVAAVTEDSFNISSVSDVGTGDFDPQFTSSMINANYSVSITIDATGAVTRSAVLVSRSTTSFEEQCTQTHQAVATESAIDGVSSFVFGDLA